MFSNSLSKFNLEQPPGIILYDYLLTFSIEVERFWIPRKSMTSTLFFLNRYVGLLGYIPIAYQLLSSPTSEQVHTLYIPSLILF